MKQAPYTCQPLYCCLAFMCILLRANVFIIVEILPWRALDTVERKGQPVDIQVVVPVPVLGVMWHTEKGISEVQTAGAAWEWTPEQLHRCKSELMPMPLGLHWVPMLCFSLLVRKTMSHPRITNTMGRTNRKVFLRSWNWPRWGQGCNLYACECCTEGLCGGPFMQSSFTAMWYPVCPCLASA